MLLMHKTRPQCRSGNHKRYLVEKSVALKILEEVALLYHLSASTLWGHLCKEVSTFSLMHMQASVPADLQAEKYVFGCPVVTFYVTDLECHESKQRRRWCQCNVSKHIYNTDNGLRYFEYWISNYNLSEFKKSQEQCLFNLGEVSFGRLSVKFPEGFYNNIFICALFRKKLTSQYAK